MSLALYRKYRPGKLADVIGQDHVVDPMRRALANNRVHHAYLFSGPRGCGKTSSARILARSLNCEQGPTPDPCEKCNSCVNLAPNGPGSIDVIELDAATHGLVDDARDLREKAIYAPAASLYKIYIIDEAHQLGPGAANALLKLVEEPPEHLRFIFATTEPDKIIGTIRSRTHHYGFRLVAARTLQAHLASICASEGFTADPAALALVARAARGSVRDSLSILGQLLAGASDAGLTYSDAADQLGVTSDNLLDEFVSALAIYDGAALFRLVDTVVEAGHEPRGFVADLLDRFRDLLIVAQVPDADETGLIDGPAERVAELVEQASKFGPGELSRCAESISTGLSELKGATAPRLQLELLVARLVLPAADSGMATLLARVEHLEKQAQAGAVAAPKGPGAITPRAVVGPPPKLSDIAPSSAGGQASQAPVTAVNAELVAESEPKVSAPAQPTDQAKPAQPESVRNRPAQTQPPATRAQPVHARPATAAPAAGGNVTIEQVRALWPAVLEEVKTSSRVAWMLVVDAHPMSVERGAVVASHSDQGTVKRFAQSGHDERIATAIGTVIGTALRVELVFGNGGSGSSAAVTSQSAQASQDSDIVDSVDADDLAGIELVQRELGAVTIKEFDEA